MSVSVALKNACRSIGEGPHWDGKSHSLLYVDIFKGDIYKWNPTTNDTHKLHLNGTVGFVSPCASGGLVTGLGRSLVAVDWDGNNLTTLAEVDKGTQNRLNDGKCDSTGRVWAGTLGPEPVFGHVEPEKGSFFSLDVNGTLKSHVSKVTVSNGIAWSLDNNTMYYIDSGPRKVYAFDFDINTATISNQRTAVNVMKPSDKDMFNPDGMCMDTDGKLWVAIFGGSKVVQFDPETGANIRSIDFPVSRITSCCFGGPNLDELYVTSACYGLSPSDVGKDEPLQGSVFKVTGLGAKGTAMYEYAG